MLEFWIVDNICHAQNDVGVSNVIVLNELEKGLDCIPSSKVVGSADIYLLEIITECINITLYFTCVFLDVTCLKRTLKLCVDLVILITYSYRNA